MIYVPNPAFVEEKGVFNIISAPKSTILPAIGMAVSVEDKRAVYLTDKNTELYQCLKVFHNRLGLFQWDYPEQILSRLKRSRPSLAIIEYNKYLFNGNQAVIENTGRELKELAESSNATYIMISPLMDENLKILCEWADRVLIVEDNNRNKDGDFIFKDRTTGCYIKRQRTIADFM
ncbi:MAG: hypothetical protein PHV39_02640 [Methanomicrobium sp.]|nr:hypothetical protein [Methanomicrobium sp.]